MTSSNEEEEYRISKEREISIDEGKTVAYDRVFVGLRSSSGVKGASYSGGRSGSERSCRRPHSMFALYSSLVMRVRDKDGKRQDRGRRALVSRLTRTHNPAPRVNIRPKS
jgi:hypothetical protein